VNWPWVRRGGLRPACLAVPAALILTALVAPGHADGARGLTTGFWAGEYTSLEESIRDRWFDATVQSNAGVIRVDVTWRNVVGDAPPADPRNPADPAYNFSRLDQTVREAHERGLEVMFTVLLAPNWAEGPDRPPVDRPGLWSPDPEALGEFAAALATRYSGGFPDPTGLGPLPRVRFFEAWNEPNLSTFLLPQWEGKKPVSPSLYRRMLNSFASGVKAAHSDNLVIAPALAPYGDPPGGQRMRPLYFLRELFCLKGRRNPEPKKGCSKGEIPRLDILSHHPINITGGPGDSATHPDDATSGDLDQVRKVLRAAERAHHVKPGGHRPIWVTESWWFSEPPVGYGPPLPIHARYVEESLYLWWKDGASTVLNYLIRDLDDVSGDFPGASGVFFADGTPKPAFDAFRFPFVADRLSKGKVRAWGKSPATGQLEIQLEGSDGWQTVKTLSVTEGAVFTTNLRIRGGATLRAVIGSDVSLPWGLGG
jgi:hypothetical protein